MPNAGADYRYSQGILWPDLIVWDMDGTLLESSASKFVNSEHESDARHVLEAMDSTYKTARSIKDTIAPNFHLSSTVKAKLLSHITSKQEYTIEALDVLSAFGIRQAIVSNNSRTAIGDKVLSLFEMHDYIESSLFREDMQGRKKPDPSIMQDLVEDLALSHEDVIWIVGDSATDMKFALLSNAAIANSVVPVAMGQGSRASAFLEENIGDMPHAVVSKPMDIAIITALTQEALNEDQQVDVYEYFLP